MRGARVKELCGRGGVLTKPERRKAKRDYMKAARQLGYARAARGEQ